jgi:hypothetical protein
MIFSANKLIERRDEGVLQAPGRQTTLVCSRIAQGDGAVNLEEELALAREAAGMSLARAVICGSWVQLTRQI